jgi:pyruvate/2-oxoglutarate dehydrogenase complex dihydrolipoamide acyltransferase (E2) component
MSHRVGVEMPKLSYDMETGVVQTWLHQTGDRVEKDEPIVDIETEKASVNVTSPASGTLADIVHESGAEVDVGTTIGWIDADDT